MSYANDYDYSGDGYDYDYADAYDYAYASPGPLKQIRGTFCNIAQRVPGCSIPFLIGGIVLIWYSMGTPGLGRFR